ncbi:MAG: hypothetical protein EBU90_07065 [Proteobacteria bacterium]|nr:hypothetical protein [Pseudomonadota bacterium]NBP14174.1 hypothetical protein [bacterium]
MNKILLISGCSHAAGAEIDGSKDSKFNREFSFGNQLARLLGRKPVNVASSGGTNATILRSIMHWIQENTNEQDVMVLASWTESTRMEIPISYEKTSDWEKEGNYADYASPHNKHFVKLNMGWKGLNDWEKEIIERVYPIMVFHELYLQISCAHIVLALHNFLKNKQIPHLMTNSMYMFNDDFRLDPYLSEIAPKNYYMMRDNEQCFYQKYKNLGYTNPKATYWHHGPDAHEAYAKELYTYINTFLTS